MDVGNFLWLLKERYFQKVFPHRMGMFFLSFIQILFYLANST